MVATINIHRQNDNSLLIEGELNFSTVMQAREQLSRALNDAGEWIIDLQQVSHADSAGMAFVCEMERYANHHGITLTWINIPAQMHNIAQVSGLEPLFSASG